MPADVSFQNVGPRDFSIESAPQTALGRRLPLGIGLTIAALASVGLWVGVGAGIRALFF